MLKIVKIAKILAQILLNVKKTMKIRKNLAQSQQY